MPFPQLYKSRSNYRHPPSTPNTEKEGHIEIRNYVRAGYSVYGTTIN